jgi:hypothetical protein
MVRRPDARANILQHPKPRFPAEVDRAAVCHVCLKWSRGAQRRDKVGRTIFAEDDGPMIPKPGPLPEPIGEMDLALCPHCGRMVLVITPDGEPPQHIDPTPPTRLRFWAEMPEDLIESFGKLDFAPGRSGVHCCG